MFGVTENLQRIKAENYDCIIKFLRLRSILKQLIEESNDGKVKIDN